MGKVVTGAGSLALTQILAEKEALASQLHTACGLVLPVTCSQAPASTPANPKELFGLFNRLPILQGAQGHHFMDDKNEMGRCFVLKEGTAVFDNADEIQLVGWALYPKEEDLKAAVLTIDGDGVAEKPVPEARQTLAVFSTTKPVDLDEDDKVRVVNLFEVSDDGVVPLGDVILYPTFRAGQYRVKIVPSAPKSCKTQHDEQVTKTVAAFHGMHRATQIAQRRQVNKGTALATGSLFLVERDQIKSVYSAVAGKK